MPAVRNPFVASSQPNLRKKKELSFFSHHKIQSVCRRVHEPNRFDLLTTNFGVRRTPRLNKELVDEFSSFFRQQAGNVHHAKSEFEAANIVNEIVRTKGGAGTVCCAPFEINGKKFDLLLQSKKLIAFEEIVSDEEKEEEKEDVLNKLAQIDVAITLPAAAISQTGSLVEISSSDNERLLSSLPRIHVAIVQAGKILANLSNLAPIIKANLSANTRKPTITLIGGPSRTSDIELKSVLGVHGPHEVHAVIIE